QRMSSSSIFYPAHVIPIPISTFKLAEYDNRRLTHRMRHGKCQIPFHAIFHKQQGLDKISVAYEFFIESISSPGLPKRATAFIAASSPWKSRRFMSALTSRWLVGIGTGSP